MVVFRWFLLETRLQSWVFWYFGQPAGFSGSKVKNYFCCKLQDLLSL